MKRTIIAVCLTLALGAANATNNSQKPEASVGNVTSGSASQSTSGALAIGVGVSESSSASNALSASSAKQDQSQGQLQAQGQKQVANGGAGGSAVGSVTASTSSTGGSSSATNSATGGTSSAATSSDATNAGNSQSLTVNEAAAPSTVTIKTVGQAPDVLSTPTAPCRIGVGASAGWIGAAFGFGTSVEDEGCTMRENARLLHNFGEKAAALKLMCNDAKVAEVLSACK